ncbi:putative beta-caryophyllene synthase-like [Capsicum annuum]|nr:putative beta-caryophyllene synthase-like [Capsicum annuum]KAF3676570.1 putative beta-caryophyllene synthase-like [Capsicum annuum]
MDGFDGEVEITRRYANHHSTVWGDPFLAYANLLGANEWEEKEHEDLKEEVRNILVMSPSKSLQKLDLINTIQLLGVAYHFEHEIEESLSNIYNCYEEWIVEYGNKSDLHAVALSFRLLIQQGYYVSSAQFRVEGEEILDKAVDFTTVQLKQILPNLCDSLAIQVSNALKFPINNNMVRVGTRKYISLYQKDELHNELLLSFAKLDFNILQRLHKRELSDITRWDIDASEQLPQYMKLSYHVLLQVYSELERELENLGNKSFRVKYSITEMKKLLRAYFQEAKWYHGKNVPTMDQYIKNGIPSSTYLLLAATSWLGMGDVATKEAFDWISTEPTVLVASCIIARLLNDLVTHEIELERGDVASGIECYMNEYGATKEVAYVEIRKIIEKKWKDLNRGCLKPAAVPRVLLMPVVNLKRVAEFFYKDEDAYTFSKNNLKDVVSVVLIDPITT